MQVLIMCRSLTQAQRSALLLERKGIGAAVVKAPQKLRANGCGYAVSVYRQPGRALALLRENGLLTGKVYRRLENGEYAEVFGDDLS